MHSDIRQIPLTLIDVDGRLRPVDHDRAQAIAESMAAAGQLEAVLVRPNGDRFTLVIGGHRVWGAKTLGWTTIEAKVQPMSALEARLKEIDENLYRHELSALDRSVFLAERKKVWEELNPETAHGGNKSSDGKFDRGHDGHTVHDRGGREAEHLGAYHPAGLHDRRGSLARGCGPGTPDVPDRSCKRP